jgi:UDP-4-amino-4,6-dideoxy-N-acetyl-beta-L-altrosamine N-acetyltransferase
VISLRVLCPEDENLLLSWRNKPDVAQWMYAEGLVTPIEHHGWFKRILAGGNWRYWVVVADERSVGIVNLTKISTHQRCCEFGMYVGEESARGTGAAAAAVYLALDQAFDVLQMHRVVCEALAHNDRAIGLYERIGFRREGLLRERIPRDGTYLDVAVLAVLASEWSTLRPGLSHQLSERNLIERGDVHE